MKRLKLIPFFFLFLFSSCDREDNKHANGGKLYGGTFKFMSAEKITNLFPLSTIETYTNRVLSQLYDPLLRFDSETMKILPCIVSSYHISEDAKKVVLTIRDDVYFHDDPCFKKGKGRLVTASDVKYSLEFSCSSLSINKYAYLLSSKIVGAEEFHDKSKQSLPASGVSGIKVLGQHSLEISLLEPNVEFYKLLTFPTLAVIAKESVEYYKGDIIKHPVGTGPFVLESMNEHGLKLKRNNHYWGKDQFGNHLPFLDRLEVLYGKDKKAELLAFRKKEIDIVFSIPLEDVENVLCPLKEARLGKNVHHKIQTFTGMNINYLAFLLKSKEFSDINVRRAFNHAINRNSIIEDSLLGDGILLNGIIPFGKGWEYSNEVKGYNYNVKQAQELFAKAGYAGGKNFPKLDFYVSTNKGSKRHKICLSIVEQLKRNLNVDLNLIVCPLPEQLKAIREGRAKIWITAWIADYPSAENFLQLFHVGKNKAFSDVVKNFGFSNEEYDNIYEAALSELNTIKREKLFMRCNQIVMDQAILVPIMSNDYTPMLNARVKDFNQSPMEVMDFSTMYIKELREKGVKSTD
jgi:oligopeptide transport system substrate-binding protein